MKKTDEAVHPEEKSLAELCELITSLTVPFDDCAGQVENKVFELCSSGKSDDAITDLVSLATFFESMEDKNEEIRRDLADMYILIGEVYQVSGIYEMSIDWFKKAILVDDTYSVPYHNLGNSYVHLGEIQSAIKCLEFEIEIEPGNYYTYLRLAELYGKNDDREKVERVYQQLLERDPDNIVALHKLVSFYEGTFSGSADTSLLRKRILGVDRELNEIELVIWTRYMCEEKKFNKALDFLSSKEENVPELSIVNLLKGYIYGKMKKFSEKRRQLTEFRRKNHNKAEHIENKLREFGEIFGAGEMKNIARRLTISHPR